MSVESWGEGHPNQRQRTIVASATANGAVGPDFFAEPHDRGAAGESDRHAARRLEQDRAPGPRAKSRPIKRRRPPARRRGSKMLRNMLLASAATMFAIPATAQTVPSADSAAISGLGVRNIGSATMSGRIAAVAGRQEKDGKVTLLVGSASGGVWKSEDGGTTFKPVFDKQPVKSIGAVALDPDQPAGGVGRHRRKLDAQFRLDRRWRLQVGRRRRDLDQRRPARDRADHTHPGPPEERQYRLRLRARPLVVRLARPRPLQDDRRRQDLGAGPQGRQPVDRLLVGDDGPVQPRASARRHLGLPPQGLRLPLRRQRSRRAVGQPLRREPRRRPHLDRPKRDNRKGLPKQPWGRLEIAYAPSNPKRVYAFIENVRSALFVSEDGGATWQERDRSQGMVWRPFYFGRMVVDPKNPDRVFKMGYSMIVSDDGGKSFANATDATHGDWHDLWINPTDAKHMVGGDDGGLWTSYDGGNRWVKG